MREAKSCSFEDNVRDATRMAEMFAAAIATRRTAAEGPEGLLAFLENVPPIPLKRRRVRRLTRETAIATLRGVQI
jgi:hypothetical protein